MQITVIDSDTLNFKFLDGDYNGYIDLDEGLVSVTFNLAPEEQEGMDKSQLLQFLKEQADLLNWITQFVAYFKGDVNGDCDFYWHDGDLLLRIEIPLNNPEFKNILECQI